MKEEKNFSFSLVSVKDLEKRKNDDSGPVDVQVC